MKTLAKDHPILVIFLTGYCFDHLKKLLKIFCIFLMADLMLFTYFMYLAIFCLPIF
jgi:hypothetical protein